MGIDRIMVNYLRIFFIGAGLISCNHNCDQIYNNLSKGSAFFSPQADSIKVGDTIWLGVLIPLELITGIDSSLINIAGASGVVTDLHFNVLTIPNVPIGAVDSFKLIQSVGKLQINSLARTASETIFFAQESDGFKFSVGIIALKPGLYDITTLDIFQAKKNA